MSNVLRKLRRNKFRKHGNKKVKALQELYTGYAEDKETCLEKRRNLMKKV